MKDTPRTPAALSAQGPLSQALTELFEKARKANVKVLKLVRIRLFEAAPTWNIHTAAANFRDADITCRFSASLEGDGIEGFNVEFAGSMAKANAVKSFLDPQLRSASNHSFEGQSTLTFKTPLVIATEKTSEFTKSITKYGGGEAYVEAELLHHRKDAMAVAIAKNQKFADRSVVDSHPLYELRAVGLPAGEILALELWQLPSPSTPRLKQAELTASLRGRQLRLIESRVLRRLKQAGISLNGVRGKIRSARSSWKKICAELVLLVSVFSPRCEASRTSAWSPTASTR